MANTDKQNDPLEKKSYSKWFFIISSLLMLITLWSMVDEGVVRRTWKGYQRKFNQLELKLMKDELSKEKEKIQATDAEREKAYAGLTVDQLPDEPEKLSRRMVRLKLEKAQIGLALPEYKKAKAELKQRQIELTDIKEEKGFAKADQDEVYYEWKHALHAGKPHQEWEKKYWELEERIKVSGGEVEKAEQRVATVQQVVDRFEEEVEKWEKAESNYFASLDPIKRRIEAIKDRTLDIQQVVIKDLGIHREVEWGKVDRCMTCHAAVDRDGFDGFPPPFKTHPARDLLLKKHPVSELGCTTCHWGQGRATQIKHAPLEEGDFVHGYEHHWTKPLLRDDFMQSSCFKCHQQQWKLDYAPVAIQGKRLFMELGCIGCHNIKGFEEFPKAGPSLERVGSKVRPEWIVDWIKNPSSYDPNTKMPKTPLEEGDAEVIASYLFQVSKGYKLPFGPYPGSGDAERGKAIFGTVGCYGCHQLEGKGSTFAPTLDRIMEKTTADWVYNWIQDPKSYIHSKMPRLRLTKQEAADMTAYLETKGTPAIPDDTVRMTLANPEHKERGFLLISQYGCYSCHDVQGTERLSKLSVDLSTIGTKAVDKLDFGDTEDVPHTWEDWVTHKIKTPQVYLHERSSSRMPQFNLTDEQRHALVVFLKGMRGEEPPSKYIPSEHSQVQRDIDAGRRLVRRLNCIGCHVIEGEGGEIASLYQDPSEAPPNLAGEGAKVQPAWLFKFLKNPGRVQIRPWLNTRMPTFDFTDEEAETLVKYFAALDKKRDLFVTLPKEPPSPEMLEAGKLLASTQFFNCFACHQQGAKKPAGPKSMWAPDLSMVPERIRPDFIPPWVQDPQQFTPGVRMPAFLPGPGTGPPTVLEGDVDKQAAALRDYLLNIHNN